MFVEIVLVKDWCSKFAFKLEYITENYVPLFIVGISFGCHLMMKHILFLGEDNDETHEYEMTVFSFEWWWKFTTTGNKSNNEVVERDTLYSVC